MVAKHPLPALSWPLPGVENIRNQISASPLADWAGKVRTGEKKDAEAMEAVMLGLASVSCSFFSIRKRTRCRLMWLLPSSIGHPAPPGHHKSHLKLLERISLPCSAISAGLQGICCHFLGAGRPGIETGPAAASPAQQVRKTKIK